MDEFLRSNFVIYLHCSQIHTDLKEVCRSIHTWTHTQTFSPFKVDLGNEDGLRDDNQITLAVGKRLLYDDKANMWKSFVKTVYT